MTAKNIHDLDDHTLAKIFNRLGIDEWIELHEMTKRFRRVIREHVIPVQKIKVVGPDVNYSTNELFEMFGKCMTKLQFDTKNYVCKGRTRNCAGSVFEVFLQMVLDYCEPGMLKNFELLDINEKIQKRLIDQEFLKRTAAYFKNVTTLRIKFQRESDTNSVTAIERWLVKIPDEQIQSLTIEFEEAQQYDFKLKQNSFPNLRKMWISFVPSNDECLNKVTDFIRVKSNLQTFYCVGLGDEIVKTVAKSFPNIKALGVIDLNSKPEDIHSELKHLRAVEIQGNMANYEEFHKIFKIIADQKTLESMGITFNNTDDATIFGKYVSFLKSECTSKKIYLKELVLESMWDRYAVMYLKYLIDNVFNFKTLYFRDVLSCKLVKSAVANVGCLENVVCRKLGRPEKYYRKWIMGRLMINQRLGTSNRITIYIDDAEEHILQLGSHYDPQLIALEPRSKFVENDYWT